MLTVGVALAALALGTAQTASAAPSPAAARGGAVVHDAPGCAGVKVLTPKPGTAATAAAMGMTANADGFYARAAASHAMWLPTMSCTTTARTHALKSASGASGASATSAASGARTGAGTAAIRNTNFISSNWSGYQITQTAQYAQSGWTVPTVSLPSPGYSGSGYYSSTWSGIGGGFNAGSGALIQSGTAQDISASGQTSYYAWYEIVGGTHDTGGEVRINNLPIHAGDAVGSGVEWTPTGGAVLGVCNFSGAGCINFTLASSAPGTSVEWIVEAPYYNGILPLADFDVVNFVNACWQTTFQTSGSCLSISAGRPQGISLQSYVFRSYQILANPVGGLTNNGENFTDMYFQPERCPTC
jgi:hypothetical protein